MKRKLLLRTLAIGMSASLLAGSLTAKENDSSSKSSDSSSSSSQSPSSTSSSSSSSTLSPTGSSTGTASSMAHKSERLSQLMGASVKNGQGETLGTINDFVVNPATGRIQFAILSLSDPAQSGKMTAVPWALVRPGADATSLTLNVDKQTLSSAQTFDATSWPDFSQPGWTQKTYSHYGIQGSGIGGRIPTGGSESGGASSSGSSSDVNPPQNGTQPDGRGTFNQGPSSNPSNPVEKSTQP